MKYTFGSTLAAQKLETILGDKHSARRKVSRLLSSYTNKLCNITSAKDPVTVLTCMELLREQTLKRVDALENLAPEVRSYTKNVVTYRYRMYRRCFEDISALLASMRKKDLTSGIKGV